MAENIARVPDDSPERCQEVTSNGQCHNQRLPDQQYCLAHIKRHQRSHDRANTKMYQVAKWQVRMNEFADSDGVKSLREEVGIARLLLEQILTQCILNKNLSYNLIR